MAQKKLKPAQTEREWRAIMHGKNKTFIRSMSDWKKAIANPKTNPLAGCDPKVIQHFTKNLKFKNGGLGHANFEEVEKVLSYRRFGRMWGRFGLGMRLFEDYRGYYCKSSGTCAVSALSEICTSSC